MKRDDREKLRQHVELDREAGGFQIRRAREAPSLTPEQIALCDAIINAHRDFRGRDWEILMTLQSNGYHVREAARVLGVPHKTVQRVMKKLPSGAGSGVR